MRAGVAIVKKQMDLASVVKQSDAVKMDTMTMTKIWEVRVMSIFGTIRQAAAFLFGIFWLFYFYFFTSWVSVGTLSSIQFREDVRKSIDSTVDQVALRIERRNQENEIRQTSIENSQKKLAEAEEQRKKIVDDIRETRGKLYQYIATLETSEKQIFEISYKPDSCVSKSVSDVTKGYCNDRLELLSAIKRKNDIKNQLLSEIKDEAEGLKKKRDDLVNFQESEASTIIDPKGKHEDLYTRMVFMEKSGYKAFLVMPTQLLALMLTMSMGALGSVMHMTWEFLRHDSDRRMRWYLLLPFIGAISAIVVFVFLKAGQFTVMTGANADTLNPFFLSFLGIVSGLLSDRAYTRVQGLGISFLGSSEEDQRRWGFGLKAAMEQNGVKSFDLAPYLEVNEKDIEKWADEKERVPFNKQLIMSSFLKRPIRQLFTDLSPDQKVVQVPNIVEESQAAAKEALVKAGLVVGEVTSKPHDTLESGQVVSQIPSAGTESPVASSVKLIVSSGPVVVPNIVEKNQTAAKEALIKAGLVAEQVTSEPHDTLESGHVVSQIPPAGTESPVGGSVKLIVSSGPAVVFDVVEQDLVHAEKIDQEQ